MTPSKSEISFAFFCLLLLGVLLVTFLLISIPIWDDGARWGIVRGHCELNPIRNLSLDQCTAARLVDAK